MTVKVRVEITEPGVAPAAFFITATGTAVDSAAIVVGQNSRVRITGVLGAGHIVWSRPTAAVPSETVGHRIEAGQVIAPEFPVASGTIFSLIEAADPAAGLGATEYETVAAGQTAQVIGGAGAGGNYIAGILVIPASTSPGVVTLLDNATSINVFAGGADSLSNLVPFFIPLGIRSVSGAWKITTGASVSCIVVGDFT